MAIILNELKVSNITLEQLMNKQVSTIFTLSNIATNFKFFTEKNNFTNLKKEQQLPWGGERPPKKKMSNFPI